MLSSISGLHFAGHWNKGVPPPPPITSLRYSLQSGSGPFVNPNTGLSYMKNIDRVETDGGGDIYWDTIPPGYTLTTTQPKNISNAYRKPPYVTLYTGSLLFSNTTSLIANFWYKRVLDTIYIDSTFTYYDVTGNGYQVYQLPDGTLRGIVISTSSNATLNTTPVIPLNTWVMITVYMNRGAGSTNRIYINGVDTGVSMYPNATVQSSQMTLTLNMQNVWPTDGSAAKYNDFRLYYDDGVTPLTMYNAQKAYYGIGVTLGTAGTATIGPAVTTTTSGPFPGTSAYGGTQVAGSWISYPASADFNLGTGDFTFEWFAKHTQLTGFQRMFTIGNYDGTDSPTTIGCSIEGSTGTLYYWVTPSGFPSSQSQISISNAVSVGVWNHVALTREGNNLKVFTNGVLRGSIPYTNAISNTTLPLWVMSQASGRTLLQERFYGSFTNFRFVKGVAVYTGSYTVPTSNLPLSSSANPFGGSNTAAIPAGSTKILLIP